MITRGPENVFSLLFTFFVSFFLQIRPHENYLSFCSLPNVTYLSEIDNISTSMLGLLRIPYISIRSLMMESNMMRTRVIATELRKKKAEEKSRDQHYIMNSADFQVLGGLDQGFSPSLLVNSEGNSYLFNCCEGTQRFSYSSKVKLSNLENVFLTNLDWNRVSGVYGLSLTLQDIGGVKFCVHSLDGIESFFDATKPFIQFYTGMSCTGKICTDDEFIDSGIRIQPIRLGYSFSPLEQTNDGSESYTKRIKSHSRLIAYYCSLPDLPGALDPEKCRQLKVPIGRDLATLKAGKDVVLANGKTVKSKDVCGPKNRGLRFLVVECPSERFLETVVHDPTIEQLRGSYNTDKQLDIVIHFSPSDIVNHPKYMRWMNGFPETCRHLLLYEQRDSILDFVDSYRMQYLLRQLDSEIFPPLIIPSGLEANFHEYDDTQPPHKQHNNEFDDEDPEVGASVRKEMNDLGRIIKAGSLDRFIIRPNSYAEFKEPTTTIDELYKSALILPHFSQQLSDLRAKQQSLPQAKNYEPEVIFLGSGSAVPSKLRNTSSVLFNFTYPKEVSIMMDCGEDTYGQIIRHYGPEKAKEMLSQLELLYVSHHHADHHIGLIQLLRHRSKLTDKPLLLLLPPGVEALLNYHNENFEDISNTYRVFPTSSLGARSKTSAIREAKASTIKQEIYDNLDGLLETLSIVDVQHCPNSVSVVMKFNIGHPNMDKFTIAYSGDTRPNEEFAIVGRDCDLLIHEATFDHRSQADALTKKHCTSTEAIRVSRQMRAKFTILTHFSQRLPKVPYFTDDFDDKIGFAFDHLQLKCPSHLGRIPLLKPILSTIFKESLGDIDMKFMKQELKKKTIKEIIRANQATD